MRTRQDPAVRAEGILQAAMALFTRDGYSNVQIEHIRRATQLSRGGFYHHFGSKSALLRALVEREQEQLVKDAGADLVTLVALGSSFASADPGVEITLSAPDDIALYLTYLEAAQDRLLAPLIESAIKRDGDGALPPAHAAEIFLAVNIRITRQVMTGKWSPDQARSFSATALRACATLIGRPGLFAPVIASWGQT